jgi:hypothetical protein
MDKVALNMVFLCNDCLKTMTYLYIYSYLSIYTLSLNAMHQIFKISENSLSLFPAPDRKSLLDKV